MTQRMTHVEECSGKRADYRVYYRRNGKLFFDAMWAATADDAVAQMVACAREMRWKIEIVGARPLSGED